MNPVKRWREERARRAAVEARYRAALDAYIEGLEWCIAAKQREVAARERYAEVLMDEYAKLGEIVREVEYPSPPNNVR